MSKPILLAALLAGAPAAAAPPAANDADDPELVWDARAAEHLLNRAAFGARRAEIDAAVAAGLDATVERLVRGGRPVGTPFFAEPFSVRDGVLDEHRQAAKARGMTHEEFKEANAALLRDLRVSEGEQANQFVAWWVDRMASGDDPLRERMTLFWHGWFTSSLKAVQSSFEMINQNELLRRHALGSFAELAHGIARDPAMLEYLDNDRNRKGTPNENFARELMELFTLGEGNYTEQDVKEVARAFTGWTDDKGEFRFARGYHDDGEKTVLGLTGRFGGEEVIDILLEQEACARYVAGGLIAYFEGPEPEGERLERYAALLRERDWDLSAFLEELFRDPEFYRDEVVGTRIASPVDYVVGLARRLDVEPPGRALALASESLGQRLFDPPNVQGWERGTAWVSTSTLMQRGNLAGAFLRLGLHPEGLEPGAATDGDAMMSMDGGAPARGGARRGDPAPRGRDRGRGEPEPSRGGRMRGGDDMSGDPMSSMSGAQGGDPDEVEGESPVERVLRRAGWVPSLNFRAHLRRAGIEKDADIADAMLDELLAIEPTPEAREEALRFLRDVRETLGLADGDLLVPRYSEHALRRLAHLILSLPEANLH